MDRLHRKAKRQVEREFHRFRSEKLLYTSKAGIWDSARRILFYCSVREYFCYNDQIPRCYLELATAEPMLLQLMWEAYLKEGHLQYQNWEGIEEILEQVMLGWRVFKSA